MEHLIYDELYDGELLYEAPSVISDASQRYQLAESGYPRYLDMDGQGDKIWLRYSLLLNIDGQKVKKMYIYVYFLIEKCIFF
jgi:hypothetical protein